MTESHRTGSCGFALLAVLWVMVGVAALGALATVAARESIAAGRNRINLTLAAWRAEGCAESARAAIAEVLRGARGDTPNESAWNDLDGTVLALPSIAYSDCEVTLRAAGAALDVNTAGARQLRSLFTALGVGSARADSLTDALLDWRDANDVARPSGAERSWYEMRLEHTPRNGPLASPAELLLIRGFGEVGRVDSLLGVEPGRVPLGHAPLLVLASLPGFTDETLHVIAERRSLGAAVPSLVQLAAGLSTASRDSLMKHQAELAGLVTVEPEAWILTSHATEGRPAIRATLEFRMVRAGDRAAVVRRRTWQ